MNRKLRGLLIALFLFFLSIGLIYPRITKFQHASAEEIEYWNNTLTLYPNSTSWQHSIRTITSDVASMDVKVEYYTGNLTKLKTYILYGNDVALVEISNSAVTTNTGTVRLQDTNSLIFDIKSVPIDAVMVGDNASVTIKITRTDLSTDGWIPGGTHTEPLPPIPPPFILTLQALTGTNFLIWNPLGANTYTATINITNTYNESKWATVKYWLTNASETTVWNGTLTIQVPAHSILTTTLTYPITQDGDYIAHAQVMLPPTTEAFQITFTARSNMPEMLALVVVFIIFLIIMGIITSKKPKPKK